MLCKKYLQSVILGARRNYETRLWYFKNINELLKFSYHGKENHTIRLARDADIDDIKVSEGIAEACCKAGQKGAR